MILLGQGRLAKESWKELGIVHISGSVLVG